MVNINNYPYSIKLININTQAEIINPELSEYVSKHISTELSAMLANAKDNKDLLWRKFIEDSDNDKAEGFSTDFSVDIGTELFANDVFAVILFDSQMLGVKEICLTPTSDIPCFFHKEHLDVTVLKSLKIHFFQEQVVKHIGKDYLCPQDLEWSFGTYYERFIVSNVDVLKGWRVVGEQYIIYDYIPCTSGTYDILMDIYKSGDPGFVTQMEC